MRTEIKFVSSRRDGLGARLSALFNALALSHYYKGDFLFWWPQSSEQMQRYDQIRENTELNSKKLTVMSKEDLFSPLFLQKYCKNLPVKDGLPFCYKNNRVNDVLKFKITKDKLEDCNFISHTPCVNYIEDMESDKYYLILVELWKSYRNIFSNRICKIIDSARDTAKALGYYESISLRMADVVWNPEYKNLGTYVFKYSPLEIMSDVIAKRPEVKFIIFSDDYSSATKLKCFFKNRDDVLLADDFLNKDYSEDEKTIFEIALMSYSGNVYMGDSNFAKFPCRVGLGKEPISITDLYTNKDRYNLIKKNINSFVLSKYQKAYSYLYLYTRAKLLNRSLKELRGIMINALILDRDNDLYRIGILYSLLKEKKYFRAENYLKYIMIVRYRVFLRVLVDDRMLFKKDILDGLQGIDLRGYPHILKLFNDIYFNKKEKNLLGAPTRIKNHLAYRLGQIAVTNSKTIGGYFRLPFNLIKEYKQYNQEQKNYQMIIKLNPTLALPKLQDYNDYQEAVKIKKYFSYRLGEAIIQANNTWYGGGYIKLWFKIKRLRKEIGKG
ncbi:sugar transferase [Campylobacter jejuni]|nr:sugar transferase [Campylobacter jejuni]